MLWIILLVCVLVFKAQAIEAWALIKSLIEAIVELIRGNTQ